MSSYRSIRPSAQNRRAASGSSSTDQQTTSPGPSESSNPVKRRRAPRYVTPIACNNCKKARAKCDGQKPACGRCRSRDGAVCHYEVHVKTAKEEMIREIRELRTKSDSLERIFIGIQDDDRGSEIIQKLQAGESWMSISESFGRDVAEATVSPLSEQRSLSGPDLVDGEESAPLSTASSYSWTRVTANEDLVNHLLLLYFTWIHPIHMFFNEANFAYSYRNHSSAHCSSILVNALCSAACSLLAEDEEDGDPDGDIQPAVLKEHFMDEVRYLLRPEQIGIATTTQALVVMFLDDLSSGNARRGSSYLRLAVESVQETTSAKISPGSLELEYLGVICLDIAWENIMCLSAHLPHFIPLPSAIQQNNAEDEVTWRLYRTRGDGDELVRPGYITTTAVNFAALSSIIQSVIALYYDHRVEKVSARAIMEQYRRLVLWHQTLPKSLADISEKAFPLPHVLFLHIQHRSAIVQLLEPLLSQDILSGPVYDHFRETLMDNAKQGLELLDLYRRLYGFRYQSPLQSFSLLRLCDFIIRIDPGRNEVSRIVRFCFGALKEARVGLQVCGPLQFMFRQRLVELGIPVPHDVAELMSGMTRYSLDDLMDACTRTTYVAPLTAIRARLDASAARDWAEAWQVELQLEQRGKVHMDINSILNG